MNATCTTCQTVFRVDPAKVPAAGVRARCSVCSGVFWVRHETATPEAAASPRPPAPPPAPPVAPPPPPPAYTAPRAAPPAAPMPAPTAPSPPPTPRYAPFPGPAAAPPVPVPPGTPYRPSAPPAPAMSVPPAAPPAPFSRPAAPPPPPAPAPAPAVPRRPANPFLSQDPSARARRLARALVSDIVVYHPAKRRDALRDGSLKLLFEEEIRKSWEEYVEQVGKQVAETTPFFTDALNEILADGQPVFP